MPVRVDGVSVIDESATPLLRSDGSRLHVNVMLGGSVSVSCDEGKPPFVLIDAGPIHVLLEPATVDAGLVETARQLTAATARFEQLVTAAVADAGGVGGS